MLLLTETARVLGLVEALAVELGGFARPTAVHLPGKAVCDLAVMLAAGGDCPADVAMLRGRPHLFGMVASDPTMSRIIGDLASDYATAIAGIAAARAHARAAAGRLPGGELREVGDRLIVDIDATLVASHFEKELAAPNYKRGFGFHPILAFADHGAGGTGAPLAAILRPSNAGSNTATDHAAVTALALAQLDSGQRGWTLVRADSAGGTKAFAQYLADEKLAYSEGFPGFLAHLKAAIDTLGQDAWIPANDGGGDLRDGAWVAEITTLLDLGDWPAGMRVVARKERPHPGAQLPLADVDGHRVPCFATNEPSGALPALEARHRQRARCEGRIKDAKDTWLTSLPYSGAASNAIWIQVVLLAMDPNDVWATTRPPTTGTTETATQAHETNTHGPRRKTPRTQDTAAINDPGEMVGLRVRSWQIAGLRRSHPRDCMGATWALPQLNGVSVVPGIISRMIGGPVGIGPWRHGDVTKDATRADGWQTCDTCGRGATTQAALNLEPCAPPAEDELAAD